MIRQMTFQDLFSTAFKQSCAFIFVLSFIRYPNSLEIMLKSVVFGCIGYSCEQSSKHVFDAFKVSAIDITPESEHIDSRT